MKYELIIIFMRLLLFCIISIYGQFLKKGDMTSGANKIRSETSGKRAEFSRDLFFLPSWENDVQLL